MLVTSYWSGKGSFVVCPALDWSFMIPLAHILYACHIIHQGDAMMLPYSDLQSLIQNLRNISEHHKLRIHFTMAQLWVRQP